MKSAIIATTIALSTTFGAQAATLVKPDRDFIDTAATVGVTLENWDSGKAAKLTMKNAYRFTHSMKMEKGTFVHDLGDAKGFDLDSFSARDVDGVHPLSVIIRDRLNQESLVILKNGQLVDEYYWSGMDKDQTHLMMSITKSFTSMTLSILVENGLVDMNAPITRYLPELKSSPAYAKASVQEVADMRSGIKIEFSEGKLWDDRMTNVQEWNGPNKYPQLKSVVDFGALIGSRDDVTTGQAYDYQCINTEMLGMVVQSVTGKKLADVMEELIWKRAGFASDAYLQSNSNGEAVGSGGLNATTRDVAVMMDILVNDGKNRNGEQIIPQKFVNSLIEGNEEVRSAWKYSKESKLAPDAWYKDQIRTFNVGSHKFLAFIGIHGQVVVGEPATGIVLAFNGAQDEMESPRTVVMTFLEVIPTLLTQVNG